MAVAKTLRTRVDEDERRRAVASHYSDYNRCLRALRNDSTRIGTARNLRSERRHLCACSRIHFFLGTSADNTSNVCNRQLRSSGKNEAKMRRGDIMKLRR